MPTPNALPSAPVPSGPEIPVPFNIVNRTNNTINSVQQSIGGLPDAGRATLIGRVLSLGTQVLPPLLIMGGIWWGVQTILGNPPRPIRQMLR